MRIPRRLAGPGHDVSELGSPARSATDPADDPYESGFANGDRNIFRSAFQKSANIAFVKQTKIYEKTNLRLSMEFLNITNTPSFDTPGNNFTGAPNFGPPYLPIGPGADPATFSDQGVGIITNPIGGARQIQFTGILQLLSCHSISRAGTLWVPVLPVGFTV